MIYVKLTFVIISHNINSHDDNKQRKVLLYPAFQAILSLIYNKNRLFMNVIRKSLLLYQYYFTLLLYVFFKVILFTGGTITEATAIPNMP